MKGLYPERQSGVNYRSSHPRKGLYKEGSKGNDQYAIGPTSFSTSAVSTMTMASHGQPSRKHPSGPLLRHFLHPMQRMGSIWMRPNGGLSSSGTQNMQSSTGQYSTQAGDPAQPVQHSVITASSFGFFLRAVAIPLERGSCVSSSGTIPGAFAASRSAAMSFGNPLSRNHFASHVLRSTSPGSRLALPEASLAFISPACRENASQYSRDSNPLARARA